MGFSQAGNSIAKPITIAVDIRTKQGGSYARDSYIQNGYIEVSPNDGLPDVSKRAALTTG